MLQGAFNRAIAVGKALCRLTCDDIVMATGISRRRVFGFLDGTLEPSPGEVRRVLAAVGIDEPALTALSVSTSSIMPAVLACAPEDIPATPRPVDEVVFVIDRLKVTFNVLDPVAFHLALMRGLGAREVPKPFRCPNLYRRAFILGRSIYLQVEPLNPRQRFAALKLHPASPDVPRVMALVRDQLVLASARVTGMDVAVDLPIDLHDVQVVPAGKTRHQVVFGASGAETIYSGVRDGNQMKVYNKVKQLQDTSGKTDWTYASVPPPP